MWDGLGTPRVYRQTAHTGRAPLAQPDSLLDVDRVMAPELLSRFVRQIGRPKPVDLAVRPEARYVNNAKLSKTSPEGAVPVSWTKATDIESSAKMHRPSCARSLKERYEL
jgi:hypothetical protein